CTSRRSPQPLNPPPTLSFSSTKPAGTCRHVSSYRPTLPSSRCHPNVPSSTRLRTCGSSCATTGFQTESSNHTTISSTIVARPGTSSSISLGASCPSDCANGRTSSDQWDSVLFTGNAATPTCLAVSAALLLGNAGALDHRRQFADVGGKARLQFLGRAGLGLDAELGVALLHLGRRHDLADRLVQEIDDVRRRPARNKHPVPRHHLVSGNARLRDRRHVGKERRALLAGGGNGADLLVHQGRFHRGIEIDHELHVVAHERDDDV